MVERPIGSRGEVLRVELSDFKRKTYISARKWYPDDNGELLPGRGLSVDVHHLPFLRAALQQMESEARRRGLLAEEDYQLADLSLPASLGGDVDATA